MFMCFLMVQLCVWCAWFWWNSATLGHHTQNWTVEIPWNFANVFLGSSRVHAFKKIQFDFPVPTAIFHPRTFMSIGPKLTEPLLRTVPLCGADAPRCGALGAAARCFAAGIFGPAHMPRKKSSRSHFFVPVGRIIDRYAHARGQGASVRCGGGGGREFECYRFHTTNYTWSYAT